MRKLVQLLVKWGKAFGRLVSWLGRNLLRLAAVMGAAYYLVFVVDCAVEADIAWWAVPLAAFYVTVWVVPILFTIALPTAVAYLLLLRMLPVAELDRRLERALAIVFAPLLLLLVFHSELLGADVWSWTAVVTALVFGSVVRLGRPA